jgi:hypothetical protein
MNHAKVVNDGIPEKIAPQSAAAENWLNPALLKVTAWFRTVRQDKGSFGAAPFMDLGRLSRPYQFGDLGQQESSKTTVNCCRIFA